MYSIRLTMTHCYLQYVYFRSIVNVTHCYLCVEYKYNVQQIIITGESDFAEGKVKHDLCSVLYGNLIIHTPSDYY